jgi:hypothetical protein
MPAKRKSDTGAATASRAKKAKIGASGHASAKAILADVDSIDLDDETAVRSAFAEIANYVNSLEDEVKELKKAQANGVAGGSNHEKSSQDVELEAQRLRVVVIRGIRKQLVVSLTKLFAHRSHPSH